MSDRRCYTAAYKRDLWAPCKGRYYKCLLRQTESGDICTCTSKYTLYQKKFTKHEWDYIPWKNNIVTDV